MSLRISDMRSNINIWVFRRKQQNVCASITVEAVFIMPMVIFLIFTLIYLTFYLHDRCVIQNLIDDTLHQSGLTLKHDTDPVTGVIRYEEINRGVFYFMYDSKEEEVVLEKKLEEKLPKSLLYLKISEINVDISRFMLTVAVDAEGKMSLPLFHTVFNSVSAIKFAADYPIHNPAETIRRCEVILSTASEIKGVEGLMNRLKEFLHIR